MTIISGEDRTPVGDRQRLQRLLWLGLALWIALLVVLLYAPALDLPYFFDDLVQIPFVRDHNLVELWTTAGGGAYYRPLSLTMWKAIDLVGIETRWLHHALNLFLHGINGFLVAFLAGRLWQRSDLRRRHLLQPVWWRRISASTLFILFPFSYQAVPWVGAAMQISVTTLVLLSLIGYWEARQSRRWPWYVLGLGAAFLAPFAHENGVLVGPLAAIIEMTSENQRGVGRSWRQPLGWTVPALVWLPIWWLAPKAVGDSLSLNGLEAVLQNMAYVGQGVAFPLTGSSGYLMRSWQLPDLWAALMLTLLGLALAALAQWRGGATRRSWLSWMWIVVAMAPVMLLLPFNYVIDGPRLLMLASVGSAWLWADALIGAFNWRPVGPGWRRLPALVAVLILGFGVIQSTRFIRGRMAEHSMLGDVVRQVSRLTVDSNANGHTAVFVNLPSWLAPAETTFALGHEGALFWPDYLAPSLLVSAQTSEVADLWLVRYDAMRPEMEYHYGVAGRDPVWGKTTEPSDLFVTEYNATEIRVSSAGQYDQALPAQPLVARFTAGEAVESQVRLLDAELIFDDQDPRLVLNWEVAEVLAGDIAVFGHVIDSQGQLLTQFDGDPLGGSYPLSMMPQGLWVSDWHYLDAPPEASSVLVGLYDRQSGMRLQAFDKHGIPLPDNAFRIDIDPATRN